MMDLRIAVQSYVDGLCAELGLCPVPQARLIQNSSPKRSCGDFNIFIRQPSFDCLRPHMPRLVKELPVVSECWSLPIERVGYSENSAYLELFLSREPAFQRLFQAIDSFRSNIDALPRTPNSEPSLNPEGASDSISINSSSNSNSSANDNQARRLLVIVHAPDQPAFDHRRSEMLASYMRTQYEACGFNVNEVKDVHLFGGESSLSKWNYERSEYFDAAKQAFDLRRYLEDRSLETELDANLGAVYLDSSAVGLAKALAGAVSACVRAMTMTTTIEDVLLCHIAPQNKAYVQQQAGVLLEILDCLKQLKDKPARQVFVIHGGTDARQSSVQDYLRQIDDYVSSSLRHRRLRVDEGSPVCSMVIRALADTKMTFELLAARQMARLKISPLSSKDESAESGGGGASFDGKGGIFVQYTCARLAVLLSNFDRAVADGRYPTCRPWRELRVEDIDLGALSLDFDWLLWRVMFKCQTALERGSALPLSVFSGDGRGEDRVFKLDLCAHSVCEALAAACVQFSTYYSKVRVLVEAQPHLMESLKARIFLLVALRSLLHRGLQMLGLQPVQRM
ncbi:hypothetical protein BIW11_07444 [Tropilaelaps mercedesae]|uniref:DALR anticodon binding domain-containing protein n=1 Tax=Tropilaelaps mercedesae TaxID=418985 RepID=A0A1V9XTZ2_9ACAR|nr:hypothetical protein BIW11_07444 [Tropilaelaps mercedesae]